MVSCPIYNLVKPRRHLPYSLLLPLKQPIAPFIVIAIDFIIGLPLSKEGNNYLLCLIDLATKYLKALIKKET
jgi:hypothetical protein